MLVAALHIAYTCQPDGLTRRVFEAYYVYRIRPVKVAAGLLNVSRRHFYAILSEFRQRVHTASIAMLEERWISSDCADD